MPVQLERTPPCPSGVCPVDWSDYISAVQTQLSRLAPLWGKRASGYASASLMLDLVDSNFVNRLRRADAREAMLRVLAPVYSSPVERWLQRVGEVLSAEAPTAVVIFPDHRIGPVACSSPEKIVETFRCHLGLPRYQSLRLAPRIPERVPLECAEQVRSIGETIVRQALNDQPLAGSISVRAPVGFLITATHTPKDRIEQRLSLVVEYDRRRNSVVWSGPEPPSSSVAMHAAIYSRFGNVKVIIHSHCKRITYSQSLEAVRTRSFVPDGISPGLEEAIEVLSCHGFTVLKGHGEVALGETVDEAMARLREYRAIADQVGTGTAQYQ